MNEREKGIEHDGIDPALIERRSGGSYTAATSSIRPITEVLARRLAQVGDPHPMRTNGLARSWNWNAYVLIDEEWGPAPDQIGRGLDALDGNDDWSYAIFVVPPDMDIRDVDFSRFPEEYLQSAGSASAMTVEIRRREADGELHQYAIGRDLDEPGEATITWPSNEPDDPHRLTVPSAEAFTAEEALPVYARYAADQSIPRGYRLRELDLSARTDSAP